MKTVKIVYIALCALVIASCVSKKKAVVDDTFSGDLSKAVTLEQMVQKINANRQTEESITSRLSLQLSTGSRKTTVGGSLKMKRNDVVQLSMVAFGIVEAGRLEFTRDYILMVDRVGHQYVKLTYRDIPSFRESGVDFYTFQSLFWSELFLLNDKGVAPAASSFEKSFVEGDVLMRNADSKRMTLTFLANALSGLIRQTSISTSGQENVPFLDWQYLEYDKLGKHEFPSKMNISVQVKSTKVEASMTLSNVKADDSWEKRTELSKRYTKVPLETVFRRIMSLTL